MKMYLLALLSFSSWAYATPKVDIKINLSLGSSFIATTNEVIGSVEKKGDSFVSQLITVKLKNLKTGVSLRDTHTLKHLDVEHFPEVQLKNAIGTNGTGKGTITIKGISKDISGVYKIDGDEIVADFDLNLPDFKIEGIRYMGLGVKDKVHVTAVVPIKK